MKKLNKDEIFEDKILRLTQKIREQDRLISELKDYRPESLENKLERLERKINDQDSAISEMKEEMSRLDINIRNLDNRSDNYMP